MPTGFSSIGRVLPGVILLSGLVACAPVAVTGFNGDSVEIQSAMSAPDAAVTAEATRICGTVRKRAEYASSRQVYAPQYMSGAYGHLFLCLAA
jgi:hypothetical protein